MKKQIVIFGGGASGLVAGIQAAREGAAVTILEHTGRPGKKLLSTGNGKCNLTNLSMPKGVYRSDNPGFAEQVLLNFTVEETLDFFKGLGILPMNRDGYVYPNSAQAASVLDVLRMEVDFLKITIVCDCQVKRITPIAAGKNGFTIQTSAGEFLASAVILATGSKAAPVTGSDGSGYELAKGLGHGIIKPLPALVQLRCKESCYKQLTGIRTEVTLELLANGEVLSTETGELQLTDYGISGIPVFQVSRYAAKALDQGKKVTARIDFLPSFSLKETDEFLASRALKMGHKAAEDFLVGVLNKKLTGVLLKLSGIKLHQTVRELSPIQLKTLAGNIKSFDTVVTATNPFASAQVCCGGVDTRQINPETMESVLVKNLYLVGELLDVDGSCGGYNLQWAWTTGIIAGKNAGRRDYDTN